MTRIRKLNNAQRHKLLIHAATVFVDNKLRKKEETLKTRLGKAICADYSKVFGKHQEILPMLGMNSEIKSLDITPYYAEMRPPTEFTLPNGNVVTRNGKYERRLIVSFSPELYRWREVLGFISDGAHYSADRPKIHLPHPIHIGPYYARTTGVIGIECHEEQLSVRGDVIVGKNWLSDKTILLLNDLMSAMNKRVKAEMALLQAIGKIIIASPTFEALVHHWPEANQIVDDLFPKPNTLTKNAIVAVSDEDKALVCRNMAERKVTAEACKIAA